MRLIMLGTGPFAVPTLQKLAVSRHEVALVITRPPTDRKATASPMQQMAEQLGLEIWAPPTVNVAESQQRIGALAVDLLVVCDYGEILRPETLSTARLGGINLHGSLLPKYRGAAPVQWSILNGDPETGNSIIQMTPGLDAGPLLAQQRTPIDPDEDAQQLETRLAAIGADAVLAVVEQLESGSTKPVLQDKQLASKAPRLKKEQGVIDWSRPAEEIKNQVRGLRPWPRTFAFLHREAAPPIRVNIDQVSVIPATGQAAALPGTLLEVGEQLLVATGEGAIAIHTLQPAGKRAMTAAEFIRGYRPAPGDRIASG